jgi:hypothetical protein
MSTPFDSPNVIVLFACLSPLGSSVFSSRLWPISASGKRRLCTVVCGILEMPWRAAAHSHKHSPPYRVIGVNVTVPPWRSEDG